MNIFWEIFWIRSCWIYEEKSSGVAINSDESYYFIGITVWVIENFLPVQVEEGNNLSNYSANRITAKLLQCNLFLLNKEAAQQWASLKVSLRQEQGGIPYQTCTNKSSSIPRKQSCICLVGLVSSGSLIFSLEM